MSKQVVLVGGGHANLFVVSRAEDFRSAGAELSLIDPGMLWYSGMATGMLGGTYSKEEDTIDLKDLCERNGVAFHQTRAVSLDREKKQVKTESGGIVSYDALSVDVGSAVDTSKVSDEQGVAWTVKPIPKLLDLKAVLEDYARNGKACRVGVVGGGPTGAEIAANIDGLCRRAGGKTSISLLTGGQRLLGGFPEGAAGKLASVLSDRGIEIRFGVRVGEIEKRDKGVGVRVSDGETLEFDEVVLATGLVPSPTVSSLGLGRSGMVVDKYLAALDDRSIFGAGDCISFKERELPKVGVFGVRQAPVLKRNLVASTIGEELEEYEPQRKFLIILNLGDGKGLAIRGGWHWHGRLAFLAKNFIDKQFMKQYRR